MMAALLALDKDKAGFLAQMETLFPNTRLTYCNHGPRHARGLQMCVLINGQEEESFDVFRGRKPEEPAPEATKPQTGDNAAFLDGLPVEKTVRENAKAVIGLLEEAQAHVHGAPAPQIHFHTLGNTDALMDVVGVCLLLHRLGVEEVVASPITVGFGQVWCRRGVLPVPAPAAAYLLRGLPTQPGFLEGERCTPTGAALLRHFVSRFHVEPVNRRIHCGIGHGKKVFAGATGLKAHLIGSV